MNIIDVGLKFKSLSYGNKPNKLVLHHAEASKCTVQDIHSWHLNNGWSGIGYHYFIRKDGSIYKGRPDGAIGAHCQGSNTNTLGICFEGNYMKETMPTAEYNAGIDLIKYLIGKYGNLPIYGHKELLATECPGANFPLADFKALKENEETATGYIVTTYLPNGYRGDGSFVG
ncbi:peptidoglycan recognition family protein, partial [Clostridium neonatale]